VKASLRFWIISALGLAVLLGLLVWGLLQWNLTNYTRMVADRLVLLAELRRGAVEQYLDTAQAELRFWSTNEEMLDAQASLIALWENPAAAEQVRHSYVEGNPNPEGFYMNLDDADDGSAYSEFHGRMHPRARLFVTERGYYDFFLIGPAGDVLYSVEKEPDFATNLVTGPWRDTLLAQVFRQAKRSPRGRIALSDLHDYEPSKGAPAMFIGTALYNVADEFLGVIAFQLPTDRILGIMNYTAGMGRTGETYLVGSDKLMRSDSRFSEESTILKQTVDTATVERALAGEQGEALVTDYRGVEVLSAYLPITVGDSRWAVMAEIDREEIVQGAARERPNFSGALLFVYGLSLWSVWYWRSRQLPGEGEQITMMDFSDSGDGGGLDG
jgi:methyl-accepting chemotaxis protein